MRAEDLGIEIPSEYQDKVDVLVDISYAGVYVKIYLKGEYSGNLYSVATLAKSVDQVKEQMNGLVSAAYRSLKRTAEADNV